jgi:hypothetical protein
MLRIRFGKSDPDGSLDRLLLVFGKTEHWLLVIFAFGPATETMISVLWASFLFSAFAAE